MSRKWVIVAWVVSLILTVAITRYGGAYYDRYSRIRQIAARTGMSVEQVQNQFPQGDSQDQQGMRSWRGGGSAGGQGQNTIVGRVDAVEDGFVTLTTPRGAQRITLLEGVKVSKAAPAALSDIKPGQQVWAEGKRTTDGNFEVSALAQIK